MNKRMIVLVVIQALFLSAAWADDYEITGNLVGEGGLLNNVRYSAYDTLNKRACVTGHSDNLLGIAEVCEVVSFIEQRTNELGQTIFVTVPYIVDSIGQYAFSGAPVSSIILPNSIKAIGAGAFSNTTSLGNIRLPEYLSNISSNLLAGSGLSNITIPRGVLAIGSGAFMNCKTLHSIRFGGHEMRIDANAFEGCSSLSRVHLPLLLTSIGSYAFKDCSTLKSIYIPNFVTTVGTFAFAGCTSIVQARLGLSVKHIGQNAFANCKSITQVISLHDPCPSTEMPAFDSSTYGQARLFVRDAKDYMEHEDWKQFWSINIIPYIGSFDYQLEYYTKEAVVIGYHVVSSSQARHRLRAADADDVHLSVPETIEVEGDEYIVNAIGSYAFYGNEELSSMLLPATIDTIGEGAFARCANLTEFLCYAHEVPIADANAFDETPVGDATLIVQPSLVDAYKATAPWNEFGAIVALDASSVDGVISEKVYDASWVDLQGRRYPSRPSHPGWYIHGNKKMVVSH